MQKLTNQAILTSKLVKSGAIISDRVKNAMELVDRIDFVKNKDKAYEDSPQRIGSNVTISAPHMHGFAMEWLSDVIIPGSKVLDVGSGSGILCALFYEMTERKGKIIGLDHIDDLVKWSIENLESSYKDAL